MTTELQGAMARYELARGNYRVAVLGALAAPGRGAAIRAAIEECRAAGAALRHLTAAAGAPAERLADAAAPLPPRPHRARPAFGIAVTDLLVGQLAGGLDR